MHPFLLLPATAACACALLFAVASPAAAQTLSQSGAAARTAEIADIAEIAYIAETAVTGITRETAWALALRGHPGLAAAGNEVEARRGALDQAGARPNPELSLLVEDTRPASRTTTLLWSQPIELAGKRDSRLAAAGHAQDGAQAALQLARAELRAAVLSGHIRLQAAQQRQALTAAMLELAQQASNAAARRVAAGKLSPVDATRARLAEAAARTELAQAAAEQVQAGLQLAANTTWTADTPRAAGMLEAAPQLPALAALQARLAESPRMALARADVQRRQALARLEQARRLPDVTVSIGVKHEASPGLDPSRRQAVLGLSVPLPLLDTNQGNLREALRLADKAGDELLLQQRQLGSELAQAHARWRAASDDIAIIERDMLPLAASASAAALKGFEYGKFSLLDVLDAQRALFQSRLAHLRALSDAHLAAVDAQRLLGAAELTYP